MISERDLLKQTGFACLVGAAAPLITAVTTRGSAKGSVRCVNIFNFLRGVEPHEPMDLTLPVQKQIELILQHRRPATWLLQFDALVSRFPAAGESTDTKRRWRHPPSGRQNVCPCP